MTLHLRSIASSLNLKLVVADVNGGLSTRQGDRARALLSDPDEPWEVCLSRCQGRRPAEAFQEHLRGQRCGKCLVRGAARDA
eukprot:740713-Pyramimonas_sp.AAC.1